MQELLLDPALSRVMTIGEGSHCDEVLWALAPGIFINHPLSRVMTFLGVKVTWNSISSRHPAPTVYAQARALPRRDPELPAQAIMGTFHVTDAVPLPEIDRRADHGLAGMRHARGNRTMKVVPASPTYSVSFTAASLRPDLARIVAEGYLELRDWDASRERILAGNLLQARSRASAIRREQEFRLRLQTLTDAELQILAQAPADARRAIAWLSVLKHSPFILALARDFLREKLATHDTTLRPSDYEHFFEGEAAAHPELAALTASTRAKIRQVALRMLREAGLLAPNAKDFTLFRPLIPAEARAAILADDPRWLGGFLVPDDEIGPRSA